MSTYISKEPFFTIRLKEKRGRGGYISEPIPTEHAPLVNVTKNNYFRNV